MEPADIMRIVLLTSRLTTSIPGIQVWVPVGFILSPVIVLYPTAAAVVSVIIFSAEMKDYMFKQHHNGFTSLQLRVNSHL